jgi:hypothetical protein
MNGGVTGAAEGGFGTFQREEKVKRRWSIKKEAVAAGRQGKTLE